MSRVKFLERYRSPSDLPARIPVFPLRGAIVPPRSTLPLNIFEPRYLAMIEDALKGDRIIGIIQPIGDGGATGSPADRLAPLQAVGSATRVIAFQEQAEGRILITLCGICRFDITGEAQTAAPYRTLQVAYDRFGGDLDKAQDVDDVPRDRLLSVVRRFLDARGLKADWNAIEKSETENLVNGLAIAGPFAPPEKQALLEAATLADRAEVLIALAEIALAGQPGTRLQ